MKKIAIILGVIILTLTGCTNNKKSEKLVIITTNFPSYDFVRAITKDQEVEIKMLVKPGEDLHHFEPTPKDIININESDLFIYNGGESDIWVNKILNSLDNKKLIKIKMMDHVKTYNEEIIEGMQDDHDDYDDALIDEHIWTSPVNAQKLLTVIKDEIIKIDTNNKEKYEQNYDEYYKKLEKLNTDFKDVVKNGKRDMVIFGDRFPFSYFTREYHLKYFAAFPGCSHENEASSKTIAFLIDKVKENKVPVVFHLELSNKKTAELISKETGARLLEFHSAHNVTLDEFNKNVTYVDIMNKNIEVLRDALN